ncbi:MAG: tRNA (adenosine(37)-N6)-threonylcarbamoyltransferase complex ATPase subunit type 1 TsaE [Rhodospirillales bacterium]|nr:tRNA (adenosine(37)-N6)-threonylcarbamoyltransferase complex ATPase subunit type 1 TsaE [Rhodospirillales bacterium]
MKATDIHTTIADEAETIAIGCQLATLARPGDVLALWGDLGVGKSVLARAFIRARCGNVDEIPSPTFTFVQVYDSAAPFQGAVYHFDLYRLGAPEEAYELDIEEAFSDGISLIEWPDRLQDLLPFSRLDVELRYAVGECGRTIAIWGSGDWSQRLEHGRALDY